MMMNFVHSDLYRLRKSGTLWGMMLFCFAFLLMRYLFEWITVKGMFGLSPAESSVIARSFLDYLAIGSTSGLLLVPTTWFAVWLIASDYKAHSFKSLFATPHARRDYILSKLALSVFLSAVVIIFMLVCSAFMPVVFGLQFELVPRVQQIIGWGVLALLVNSMYSAICIFFAILVANETMAWVCNMLLVLGLAGAAVMAGLNLIPLVLPGSTEIVHAISGCLPVAQCAFMDRGLDVFIQSFDLQHFILVCLAWIIVSGIASMVIFRRKAL